MRCDEATRRLPFPPPGAPHYDRPVESDATLEIRYTCRKCGHAARLERRRAHLFLVCGNPECGAARTFRADAQPAAQPGANLDAD